MLKFEWSKFRYDDTLISADDRNIKLLSTQNGKSFSKNSRRLPRPEQKSFYQSCLSVILQHNILQTEIFSVPDVLLQMI
jgi:hypothetical protein